MVPIQIAEAYVELRVRSDRARQEARDQARSTAQEVTRTFAQVFSAVVVVRELRNMTDAASNLEQAIGGTAAIFGQSSRIIDSFARSSAQSFGISERAARELTSQIGGLLQGLGFTQEEAAKTSVNLAQLGADLAATFGGRPEEAVQALGAALRGEFDPLERFGISLRQSAINVEAVRLGLAETTSKVDDNARAQAALSLITQQSAGAQGQFAREADTAAGKQARFTAELENTRAKVGEVLIPIFTTAIAVLGDVLDVFGELPPAVQGSVIALVALAAVAGPANTAISAIGDLATVLPRLATPTGLLVTSLAALAVGFVIATRDTDRYAEAAARTKQAVASLRDELARFDSPVELLQDKFRELVLDNDLLRRSLAETGISIADLANAGAGPLATARDFDTLALEIQRAALATGANREEVFALIRELGELNELTNILIDDNAEYAAVSGEAAEGAEGVADAAKEQAVEIANAHEAITTNLRSVAKLRDEWQQLADAATSLDTALDRVLGGYLDLDEATAALFEAAENLTGALEENGATLDVATQEGRANRDMVRQQVTAILDFAAAGVRAGDSTEQAAGKVAFLTQSLRDQLTQAGFTREEIDAYIASLGLTPENISTAIELTNTEITRQKLTDHVNALNGVPTETTTAIQALIDEGAFAQAELRLEQLTRRRIVQVAPTGGGVQGGGQRTALGRFVAGGSWMYTSLGENPGRGGDEVVLPLGNQSRLAELLADPRVTDRVAAAMPQASGGGGVAVPSSMTVVIEGRPFRAAIVDYQTEMQGAI